MKKLSKLGQAGMTLIEIMVVITIIGLIATVVTVNVLDRLTEANIATTKTQIKSLESGLDEYRRSNGRYPTTEQGLKALVEKPTVGKIPNNYPKNGYLKGGKIPKDSFGNDFIYYSPGIYGHEYEIISLGNDGQEGGEDEDSDIKSWEIVQ